MKTTVVLISGLLLLSFSLRAQEEACVVKSKDIKGVYTGACVNGKANGIGKSVGTDQYEGEFKDGYPDGKGTYIWKDGHYFVGNYKMGNKEGKGDMYYESVTGADSVITGYWKKDKYIGEYEKQFVVVATSNSMTKVDCRLVDTKGDNINITIHQMASASSIGTTLPIPYVTDVSYVMGTFNNKVDQKLPNTNITRIQQVVYPFKAFIYLSNGENTQILFNAKGNYEVTINIQ